MVKILPEEFFNRLLSCLVYPALKRAESSRSTVLHKSGSPDSNSASRHPDRKVAGLDSQPQRVAESHSNTKWWKSRNVRCAGVSFAVSHISVRSVVLKSAARLKSTGEDRKNYRPENGHVFAVKRTVDKHAPLIERLPGMRH